MAVPRTNHDRKGNIPILVILGLLLGAGVLMNRKLPASPATSSSETTTTAFATIAIAGVPEIPASVIKPMVFPVFVPQHDHRVSPDNAQWYVADKLGDIAGWVSDDFNRIAPAILSRIQHAKIGIEGSVGELGVHHGLFFVALMLETLKEEPIIALDVFELQNLNIDASGRGSKRHFIDTIGKVGISETETHFITGSSIDFNPQQILDKVGNIPFRLFSVDAGHTMELTYNDLNLASCIIAPGGIVIVDDYVNFDWLGVVSGVHAHLMRPPAACHRLVPFFMGASLNKIYFTTTGKEEEEEYVNVYQDALRSAYGTSAFFYQKLHDHKVLALHQDRRPVLLNDLAGTFFG